MNFGNLKVPILQAPIEATVKLAAAVSNTGGMGSMGLALTEPDAAVKLVDELRRITPHPFFVNFVLAFEPRAFDAVIEAGVPAITLSWGLAPDLIERAHRRDVSIGVQIGSVDGAKAAIADGADFVICQGVEAGGHVQSTTELSILLPQVLDIAKDVPVVAAGGLADERDVRCVLDQGATAAMLGTRFVATEESEAHPLYKNAIVAAEESDTVYTTCFDGGWPSAPHRVIRNPRDVRDAGIGQEKASFWPFILPGKRSGNMMSMNLCSISLLTTYPTGVYTQDSAATRYSTYPV